MFKTAAKIYLLIIWLLALGISVWAEPLKVNVQELPQNLSAQWRYSPGDNLEWAQPSFDDSKWQTADLTKVWSRRSPINNAGFSWYRLTVVLPFKNDKLDRFDNYNLLGVTLRGVEYSSYEVYAGGTLIGRFGTVSPEPQTLVSTPKTFPIPRQSIGIDGQIYLAVRLWRDPVYVKLLPEMIDHRPMELFTLGNYTAQGKGAELQKYQILFADLPKILCCCLVAMAALYHLQLYRRRRELKEYFWFGILALGAATNTLFFSTFLDEYIGPIAAYTIAICATHITVFSWIQFLWTLFKWPFGRISRAYQATQITFLVATIIFPHFVIAHFGNWPVISMIPIMLVWLVYIPQEAWRGNPEARTICFGVFCLALTRTYQILPIFFKVPYYNFSHWGLFTLIFSIAVSLSNRFSRVYSELDNLNQDLENKVTQRTAELAETVSQLQISEKKALSANKAKSTFLANMSHELRTPLNAIIGFAQLMTRHKNLSTEQRHQLSIVITSGQTLLRLINDVLSISKIEAGKLTLNEESFDLPLLLQETGEMIRLRVQEKDLQFNLVLSKTLPKHVFADRGKLQQILINLLGNAVKFTEKGFVTLHTEWRDGVGYFQVEDTGYGIDEEEFSALFTPLLQTESGRRAKEGTGLGLSISLNFVRIMGGDITVDSKLKKGSIFKFSVKLPLATSLQTQAIPKKVVGLVESQNFYRILVVDDKEENLALLTGLLSLIGFKVQKACNGEEAITLWQSWHPHLILMDMRMPVMDGFTATRKIREIENANDDERTVIIALSASVFDSDRSAVISAGCDDFIAKPFSEPILLEKLSTYLSVKYVYEVSANEVEQALIGNTSLAFGPSDSLADHLKIISPQLIESLNLAINIGDQAAAYKVIEKIAKKDTELARQLKDMVKNFLFHEIEELLESAQKNKAKQPTAE